jgi:hypothetical protein
MFYAILLSFVCFIQGEGECALTKKTVFTFHPLSLQNGVEMTIHVKKTEFRAAIERIQDNRNFASNGEFHLGSISREPEKTLYDKNGRLAFLGSSVRGKVKPSCPVSAEFTEAVVEPQLLCLTRETFGPAEEFLSAHWEANLNARKEVMKAAEQSGCMLNEMGSGFYTQEELLNVQSWVTRIPNRYEAILAELTSRFGATHTVRFDYLDGTSEKVTVPGHPALAISLAQDSLNVGFCPDHIGQYFDFFQGPAQLISALFSNSPILGDRLGKRYNNRIFQWRKAMSRKGTYTPYSLGAYTDIKGPQVLQSHLEYVYKHARQILTVEQAGKVSQEFRPWPTLRLLSGTLWLLSTRLQWRHNDDGEIVLWLEVRSVDAQPTLGMAMAVELAMIGYALYWIKGQGIKSVTEVMPHDTARACFEHILLHGPYSSLPLPGSPTGAEWFDSISSKIIEGLVADKVCSEELAYSATTLLRSSLHDGMTGSLWVRKKVAQYMEKFNLNETEALQRVIRYLSDYKYDQSFEFGEFQDQGLPIIK